MKKQMSLDDVVTLMLKYDTRRVQEIELKHGVKREEIELALKHAPWKIVLRERGDAP